MFENQIFDYEDKRNSQIIYLQKLTRPSNAIYNFLLLAVMLVIGLLPFIHIGLTSSAPASIESSFLKEGITAPFSGKISVFRLQDNRHVSKGDTIFEINYAATGKEIDIIKKREQDLVHSLHDIAALRDIGDSHKPPSLITSQYQAQYIHFLQQQNELTAKYDNAVQDYNRYTTLYQGKAISSSEYETHLLAYKQAKAELKLLETQSHSQWQNEQFQLNQELNDIRVKQNQLHEIEKNSVVMANMSGIGYKEDGIQTGVYVQAGQKIAQIYPDNNLIIECFVGPKDIGFIKPGQKMSVQIDAYNYNEWGLLRGQVFELAKDVSLIDNKPYYLVKCSIERPFLTLKNGYKATVIKGMTGKANFYLSSRTVWQLLFTKVNDWLNPRTN